MLVPMPKTHNNKRLRNVSSGIASREATLSKRFVKPTRSSTSFKISIRYRCGHCLAIANLSRSILCGSSCGVKGVTLMAPFFPLLLIMTLALVGIESLNPFNLSSICFFLFSINVFASFGRPSRLK